MMQSPASPASQNLVANTEKRLACGTIAAYSAPRMPFSAIDLLIRPARITVYRDALGMTIAAQAMIVSLCKSADVLLGFMLGTLSDATRKRWVGDGEEANERLFGEWLRSGARGLGGRRHSTPRARAHAKDVREKRDRTRNIPHQQIDAQPL